MLRGQQYGRNKLTITQLWDMARRLLATALGDSASIDTEKVLSSIPSSFKPKNAGISATQ
jgi:hypothetical protein